MNHSTIEIVEAGIRDGLIIEMQHYGPWPQEFRFARLSKPNLSCWLMKEPACANLEIMETIIVDIYVNSGRRRDGRWIFIRNKT